MANQSIANAFERFWQHIIAKLGTKADVDHMHDDVYYTEAEVDNKLDDKADIDHEHENYVDLESAQTVNGAKTFNSILTVTNGAIYMDNARYLHGKDTSGSERPLIGFSSGDNLLIGDSDHTTQPIGIYGHVTISGDIAVNGGDINVENSDLATAYTNLSKI